MKSILKNKFIFSLLIMAMIVSGLTININWRGETSGAEVFVSTQTVVPGDAVHIKTTAELKAFFDSADTYGILDNDITDFSYGSQIGSNKKLNEGKTLDGNGFTITIHPAVGGGGTWPQYERGGLDIENNGFTNLEGVVIAEQVRKGTVICPGGLFLVQNDGVLKNINFKINNNFSYSGIYGDNIGTFGLITGINRGTIENCKLDIPANVTGSIHKPTASTETNKGYKGANYLMFMGGYAGINTGVISKNRLNLDGKLLALTKGWWDWDIISKYHNIKCAKTHIGGITGAMYGGIINGIIVKGSGSLTASSIKEGKTEQDLMEIPIAIKTSGIIAGTTSYFINSNDDQALETTFTTANGVAEGVIKNIFIDSAATTTSSIVQKGKDYMNNNSIVGDNSKSLNDKPNFDNIQNIIISNTSNAGFKKVIASNTGANANYLEYNPNTMGAVSFLEDGRIKIEMKKPADGQSAKDIYFHEIYDETLTGEKVNVYSSYKDNNETTATAIVGENRSTYSIIPFQDPSHKERRINYKIGKFYNASYTFEGKTKEYDGNAYTLPNKLSVSYTKDTQAVSEDMAFGTNTTIEVKTQQSEMKKDVGSYNVTIQKTAGNENKDWGFYRQSQQDTSQYELFLIDMKQPVTVKYEITPKTLKFNAPQVLTNIFDNKVREIFGDMTNNVPSDDIKVQFVDSNKPEIKNVDTYTLTSTLVGVDAKNYTLGNTETVSYSVTPCSVIAIFDQQNNMNVDYNAQLDDFTYKVYINSGEKNVLLSDELLAILSQNILYKDVTSSIPDEQKLKDSSTILKEAGNFTVESVLAVDTSKTLAKNFVIEQSLLNYSINKIDPTICKLPEDWKGGFSPEKTLKDYTFEKFEIITPGEWKWDNESVVPDPVTASYTAKFIPTNQRSYNNLNDIIITITIAKASYTPPLVGLPKMIDYVEGKSLKEITFNESEEDLKLGKWHWVEENTLLEVKHNTTPYIAQFIPNDKDRYATTNAKVYITINPIDPTIEELPVVQPFDYDGKTPLSDKLLANSEKNEIGAWAWKNGEIIPTVVNEGYIAVFTPYIKGSQERNLNYNIVERTISVVVNKVEVDLDITPENIFLKQPLDESFVTVVPTFGQDDKMVSVKGTYTIDWKDGEPQEVGQHLAIVTFTPDETETNFKQTQKEVSITVEKIVVRFDDTITQPVDKETSYNEVVELPNPPTKDGYTFVGWFDAEGEVDESTLLTENRTVTARFETISYTITLNLNGGTLAKEYVLPEGVSIEGNVITYNIESAQIVLPVLSEITKNGYTFKQWEKAQTPITTVETGTWENMELEAIYTLNPVENVSIVAGESGLTATYNGQVVVTLTVSHDKVEGLNYTYEWYKDDTPILDSNKESIQLTNVKESGNYVVKVKVDDTIQNTEFTASEGAVVDIQKATPTINVDAIEKNPIYTGKVIAISGATISNIVNVDSLISYNCDLEIKDVNVYNVKVKIEATDNYEMAEQDITITVEKADIVLDIQAKEIFEEQPLTSEFVTVVATFGEENTVVEGIVSIEWKDAELTEGKRTATVTFTPNDTQNLNTKSQDVEIVVNKIVVKFVVDGENYAEEQTVYDAVVKLPNAPTKNGYTFAGWFDAEGEVDELTQFTKNRTVEAKFDIITYNIITDYNNGNHTKDVPDTYNIETETIVLPTAEHITKAGYTFAGWFDGEKIIQTIDKGSFGEINLKATYTLNNPTNVVINGYAQKVTYTGDVVVTLTVSHDKVEGLNYTYEWYKGDVAILDSNKESIQLTNVNESGAYSVKVTATENVPSESETQTTYTTSEVVNVEIEKADPTIDNNPTFSVTYDPNKTLKDLTFDIYNVNGEWSWDDEMQVPTVTNSGYSATFTPTDTDNYNTLTATIVVTVAKANVTIDTTSVKKEYTYNGSLITVDSGATKTNTDEDAVIVYSDNKFTNAGKYTVNLVVEATANYNRATATVVVTVARAEAIIDVSKVTRSHIYTGKEIAITGATLNHTECELTYSITTVKDVKNYEVTISAAQTTNYEAAEVKGITITVEKADIVLDIQAKEIFEEQPLTSEFVTVVATFGEENTVVEGIVSIGWKDEELTEGKRTATVTFTPNDTQNLNTKSQDVEIVVNKIVVKFVVDGIDYAEKQTVYDAVVELPNAPTKDGYTFVGWFDTDEIELDSQTKLFGNKIVTARFETIKYEITLNLNKGQISSDYKLPDGATLLDNVISYEVVTDTIVLPVTSEVKKVGYVFVGWFKEGVDTPITTIEKGTFENITLNAVYEIDGKINLKIDGYTEPVDYNKGNVVVTLTTSHNKVDGFTYSYEWYKYNKKLDIFEKLETLGTINLELSKVSDSGIYKVVVTIKDNVLENKIVESNPIDVVINKATVEFKLKYKGTQEEIDVNVNFTFGSFEKDFFDIEIPEEFVGKISQRWYHKVKTKDLFKIASESNEDVWEYTSDVKDAGEYKLEFMIQQDDNHKLSKTEYFVTINPKKVELQWKNVDKPVVDGKFVVECSYIDLGGTEVKVLVIDGATIKPGEHTLTAILNDSNYEAINGVVKINIPSDNTMLFIIIGAALGGVLLIIVVVVSILLAKKKKGSKTATETGTEEN